MTPYLLVAVPLVLVSILFALGLCEAASAADDETERLLRERRRTGDWLWPAAPDLRGDSAQNAPAVPTSSAAGASLDNEQRPAGSGPGAADPRSEVTP